MAQNLYKTNTILKREKENLNIFTTHFINLNEFIYLLSKMK